MISFIGTGNIRAGLLRHQISGGEHPREATYREAYSVLPFDIDLTTTILICRQIKDFLEQQFGNSERGKNRILQIPQGFSYAWNKNAPQDNRVDAASIKVNGKTLNPEGLYYVTINRFLAEGDDKFSVFENGTQRIGGSDLEIFIAYLKEYPLIPLRLGGRISLSP